MRAEDGTEELRMAPASEPLAIVGMACRFPGAPSIDDFWDLLRNGRNAVTEVPASRFDAATHHAEGSTRYGHLTSKWGGFLENIDSFDHRAFGFTPREARQLDPQQRLMLELAWEALDDASIAPSSIAGSSTAVFAGVMWNDYFRLQAQNECMDPFTLSGTGLAFIANRVSHFFNLRGPCLAVTNECASSLLALHCAMQSIRSGESERALVGGVNVLLSLDSYLAQSKAGIFAADGRCKVFDTKADGFVPAEGGGLLVIERVSKALADGRRIYALIRGSHANHNGHTPWIQAVDEQAQRRLLEGAFANAGVAPAAMSYVELHGTGTRVGDPVEARAVSAATRSGRIPGQPLVVGSVKTNIGHPESAGSMAHVIKVALALHHGEIPPSFSPDDPNPDIPLEQLGLKYAGERGPWPTAPGQRFAGVTSLSFGGSNCHVVLSDTPVPRSCDDATAGPHSPRVEILPVSARTPGALVQLTMRYAEWVESVPDPVVNTFCAAAARSRDHHAHRLAGQGQTGAELAHSLRQAAREISANPKRSPGPNVIFLYSGTGGERARMGLELYERFSVYRESFERVSGVVQEIADWSVLEEVSRSADVSAVQRCDYDIAPVVSFCLQVALTDLWRSWGVVPSSVVGHSVGEIAAAHAAGVLSLQDAVRLSVARGKIVRRHADSIGGGVMQVSCSAAVLRPLLAPWTNKLFIAGYTGPGSCLVAGKTDDLAVFSGALDAQDIEHRALRAKVPVHTPLLAGATQEFLAEAGFVRPRPASIPIASTVTGAFCAGEAMGPQHWAQQLVHPVQLSNAVATLATPTALFVEIGPTRSLSHVVHETLRECAPGAQAVGSLRAEAETTALFAAISRLYATGWDFNWAGVYERPSRFVSLPRYAWDRQHCWFQPRPKPPAQSSPTAPGKKLLGRSLDTPLGGQALWQMDLGADELPWVSDHCVQNTPVLPASGYLEMIAEAAAELCPGEGFEVCDLEFLRALVLKPGQWRRVQLSFISGSVEKAWRVTVHSRSLGGTQEGRWSLHAQAVVQIRSQTIEPRSTLRPSGDCLDQSAVYARLAARGIQYGPLFQGIREAWLLERGGVIANLKQPPGLARDSGFMFHPALLDACMHTSILALNEGPAVMPVSVEHVRFFGEPQSDMVAVVAAAGADPGVGRDLHIYGTNGSAIFSACGIRFREIESGRDREAVPSWCYETLWRPTEIPHTTPHIAPKHEVVVFPAPGASAADVAAGLEAETALTVRLVQEASLEALSRELEAAACDSVVFVTGDPGSFCPATDNALATHSSELLGVMVSVVRAVSQARNKTPRLWIATRGVHAIESASDAINLEQAALWGLGRSLSLEYSKIWGGLVDMGPGALQASDARSLASALLAEGSNREDLVAIRSGTTFCQRLELLSGNLFDDTPVFRPRPDGAYLITGGMGGIGLQLADWLVDRGATKLVLTGRTPLPADTEDTRPLPDNIRERLAAVAALRKRGVEVRAVGVDVGDAKAMKSLVDSIESELGPFAGVFHLAGAVSYKSIDELRTVDFQRDCRAKVDGALTLHRLFQHHNLDVFVLFSSISSVLSSPQLGSYAAGNAFMDALAWYRRNAGLPAQSINWGLWADVGMVTYGGAAAGGPGASQGLNAMAGADALATMSAASGSVWARIPQMTILDMDWPVWQLTHAQAARAPLLTGLVTPPQTDTASTVLPPSVAPTDLDSLPSEQRLEGIQEYLLAKASQILQLPADTIQTNTALIDLGFDSLMGIELRNHVQAEVGIKLSIMQIFNADGLNSLAEEITAALDSKGP